jgi:hypothetical protein
VGLESDGGVMHTDLFTYLAHDHGRLERLLNEAARDPERIELRPYEEFRKGLLRHIAIEERILLPAIARSRGGRAAPDAERLRLDHGALAALLVPPPSSPVIRTIRHILSIHNALEEGEGGIYRALEHLARAEHDAVLERMKETPAVPVMPFNDRAEVLDATRRALARAGYELK